MLRPSRPSGAEADSGVATGDDCAAEAAVDEAKMMAYMVITEIIRGRNLMIGFILTNLAIFAEQRSKFL
jgi:hypothetical protein